MKFNADGKRKPFNGDKSEYHKTQDQEEREAKETQ